MNDLETDSASEPPWGMRICILASVLCVSCGAAGTSTTTPTTTLTCDDAAKAMDYWIGGQTRVADSKERAVKAATITHERCTTDGWSPHAIECIVSRAGTPGICIRSGAHKDDLVANCTKTTSSPYGSGCSGFKQAQAEAYMTAIKDGVNCDPGDGSASFFCK